MSKNITKNRNRVKNRNNNQSFKIIIILLTLSLLGSFFYIYKMSDRSKKIILSLREEKSYILNEKATILKDLEKSKLFIEQALSNKSNVNEQLLLEQEKVKKLIAEIKKSEVSQAKMEELKEGANNVNDRINTLVKQLDFYKKKADSTSVILVKQKVLNDTLVNSNKVLAKKITSASKLYYYDLQMEAFKLNSDNEKAATEKARKTQLLKISFHIAENNLVNPSTNTVYIQVIDPNNNVIGEKATINVDNNLLTYSFATSVKYKNKTIKVDSELPVEGLEKGTYFVNVFDRSNLILHNSITLK